jgi:hypothetical protein
MRVGPRNRYALDTSYREGRKVLDAMGVVALEIRKRWTEVSREDTPIGRGTQNFLLHDVNFQILCIWKED